MQDFAIPAGDTANINFTIEDPENESLVGAVVNWRVFRQRHGEPLEELFAKSSTNAAELEILSAEERTFVVRLRSADTADLEPGLYYHEAKARTQSGSIITAVRGYMALLDVGIPPTGVA